MIARKECVPIIVSKYDFDIAAREQSHNTVDLRPFLS